MQLSCSAQSTHVFLFIIVLMEVMKIIKQIFIFMIILTALHGTIHHSAKAWFSKINISKFAVSGESLAHFC